MQTSRSPNGASPSLWFPNADAMEDYLESGVMPLDTAIGAMESGLILDHDDSEHYYLTAAVRHFDSHLS